MILAQLGRFAGVGAIATGLHVTVALIAQGPLNAAPLFANLAGFVAAFLFSYVGHATVTFRVDAQDAGQLRRFLAVSLLGLLASTVATQLIHITYGAPFWVAMVIVGLIVPLITFIASKWWVFLAKNA